MTRVMDMIARWEPFWQGVFFLLVLGSLFALIQNIAFYVAVMFRGWPDDKTD